MKSQLSPIRPHAQQQPVNPQPRFGSIFFGIEVDYPYIKIVDDGKTDLLDVTANWYKPDNFELREGWEQTELGREIGSGQFIKNYKWMSEPGSKEHNDKLTEKLSPKLQDFVETFVTNPTAREIFTKVLSSPRLFVHKSELGTWSTGKLEDHPALSISAPGSTENPEIQTLIRQFESEG